MDGAGEFRIFLQLVIPLSKPVIATLALFVAVGHWNDWFTTMLYASDRDWLSVLQYELMKILNTANISGGQGQDKAAMANAAKLLAQTQAQSVTPNSIRAAMTIFATVPILLVYPFLQKYFVQGFNIGAIKE
jgi:putative aldouronate transport system permease protein